MDLLGSRRYSSVWKYFTVKDNFLATCKACNNDYSFRSTIGNLSKHLKKKHAKDINDDSSDASDEGSNHSDDISKKPTKTEPSFKSTWQYFDVLDSDKFVARCKLCEKDIAYDSISDLTEHAREHDVLVSDDEEFQLMSSNKVNQPKTRKPSPLWRYMRRVGDRCAVCQLCMKKLSYAAGSSNLKKHLRRAHPEANLNDDDSEQKVLISANGQIYELQTSDGEKDPISTNEVYLESDYCVDNFETVQTKSPIKKKNKKFKYTEKRKSNLVKNIYHNNGNSSDEDVHVKNNNKKDTIDYFGAYIISMLKELPKQVSDQLQCEIVKQIVTAKVAVDTEYSTTILDKPVTVTIKNGASNGIPEITVNNNKTVETVDEKSVE